MDNNKIRAEQIAFSVSDPDRFQLLKKLADSITKATPVDTRFKKPKKNCSKCYGRGYIGFLNGQKNVPIPCLCVFVKQPMGLVKDAPKRQDWKCSKCGKKVDPGPNWTDGVLYCSLQCSDM